MVKFIKKRDGKIDRFDNDRIEKAISKAASSVGYSEEKTKKIIDLVTDKVNKKYVKDIPSIEDIESIILRTLEEKGYNTILKSYKDYRDKRREARRVLAIATKDKQKNTTDKALLIESDSKEIIGGWDRKRVENNLVEEADLTRDLARDIAKLVENIVIDMYLRGVRRISTTDIRAIVDLVLRQEGLESQRRKQALLGFPSSDFDNILISRSLENSNVSSNNPEAVNLETAERIQKQYSLERVFSSEVSEAHLKGDIHIHDLGYPARVYCSSHSLEYIKKYGLNKVLANLESKSNPPNSAAVLNQHVQTFLASMQAHYAGALGFGFLNILYSPLINRPVEVWEIELNSKKMEFEKRDLEKLIEQRVIKSEDIKIISKSFKLKEISKREMLQIAQNLIFAASQNAFSRGGQTLFIDFNIHAGVPKYMKNVPAIGPKGKYMVMKKDKTVCLVDEVPRYYNPKNKDDPKNGDAASFLLKEDLKNGNIITYGDLEETSQKFAMALLEVWRRGDKNGRPFHFPKCDLHVDEDSFSDKKQREVLDFAFEVTKENGAVYFMFDRGNDAVLAQCCRLKEKIEDSSMLKYPEKLRFCGFQNVSINLTHAAFKGGDITGLKENIEKAMNFALKAHLQKSKFMKKLLETDGSPMRGLGKESDDGNPYIDLKKATYIIGTIGLNEAVQVLCDEQLHESEAAYRLGLEIISFVYKKIKEFAKKTGLKFTIEETPAESATRRLAKVDLSGFEQAENIIKGTKENPYYTNSIHFSPDAPVGLIDRIVGQSNFHELIESGAIIHAYLGEKRPNKDSISHIVEKTLKDTRCAQLVFSPTYTECDVCGNTMNGDKKLCDNLDCPNSKQETVDVKTLFAVTRVVGYYSRVSHWNGSQKQIFEDRKNAEEYYAGLKTGEMSWLHNPKGNGKLIIREFAKTDCPNCRLLEKQIKEKINSLGLNEKVDLKIIHLDDSDEKSLSEAALYGVPFDSVPSLVIAGKKQHWKKTTEYGADEKCEKGVCSVNPVLNEKTELISPEEVELKIKDLYSEFE